RREAALEPREAVVRNLQTGLLRQRHAVPQASMRKEVIVLTLVPCAVRKQAGLEQRYDSRRAEDRALPAGIVSEDGSRGEQRHVVPHLSVRSVLVELRDDRPARLDDTVAEAAGEHGIKRQIRGDANLQEPDRLEVGAEEETRRAEHVVDVRIA